MNGSPRAKAGPIMEAAGAALLVIAFAIEVLQQQPRWVMRLSLGAAVVLIVAAALNTAVRRAWLAALCGLALILAVSQLDTAVRCPPSPGRHRTHRRNPSRIHRPSCGHPTIRRTARACEK
ncbi:hypothetical protein [Streptomyces violaceusniger]|uniref:Uncharacterized protein n=1 Tax=Streptomyces violaceusniger TaxID=68280 RepID=A0A4D4LDK8_STRVO|nr:hypothetical protein SVIO_098180 [Streptomyces violaceusniger]